jgi:pullulanase
MLKQKIYRDTFEYYKGLFAFRKAHPVLRLTSSYDVLSHVIAVPSAHPNVCAFQLTGNLNAEPADALFMIFNASKEPFTMDLPAGTWQVCINEKTAGAHAITTVTDKVCVAAVSAMVLVKGN